MRFMKILRILIAAALVHTLAAAAIPAATVAPPATTDLPGGAA